MSMVFNKILCYSKSKLFKQIAAEGDYKTVCLGLSGAIAIEEDIDTYI